MNPHEVAARSVLAGMPEEVFESWMRERIATAGWPPAGVRWFRLLAGFTIEQWSNFSWSREQVDLLSIPFSQDAIKIVRGLSEAHFKQANNAYSKIEGTRARMQSIFQHIKATRNLPGSVILIDNSHWELVDGCHRVAMYAAWHRHPELGSEIERFQSAWVARPAAGGIAAKARA